MTKQQYKSLQAISQLINENGHSPTLQEVGNILGISRQATHTIVRNLVDDGFVHMPPRRHRSLEITRKGQDRLTLKEGE